MNERADGSPCVIVAITPREFEREEDLVMAEVGHGEWVDWAVRSSLNVLISELGASPRTSALIRLEATALDERRSEALAVLAGMQAD